MMPLPMTDLRHLCPPVYDQGQLGSCTGNAIAAAYEFDMMRQKQPSFIPSRLFIYWNERSMENTIATDSGAFIHDGIHIIEQYGVCPEEVWPYTSEIATKPSDEAYKAAMRHKSIRSTQIDLNLSSIAIALANGFPVIAAIQLFPDFDGAQVAKTGIVPVPLPSQTSIGGHAVMIVGNNEASQYFIVRNSWGSDWGDNGYFYLPYAYLPYMSDMWCIEVVT